MATSRGTGISWVLVLVLVAALGVGAAASVLVGASTTPPPSGPVQQFILPLWVPLAAMLGLLGVMIANLVVQRRQGPSYPGTNRALVIVLTVILLAALFTVAMRAAGVGGQSEGGSSLVPPPSKGNSNNTSTSKAPNLNGPGSYLTLFPNLPFWVPFVILAGVAVVLAVFAVPRAREYLAERRAASRKRGTPAVPDQVRAALRHASEQLDQGDDPRLVILSLYHEMLVHLQPKVGSIEVWTPEEIRANHLERLGVRPEAARTLTRLFEEARYSTHRLGAADSDRARAAVRATLEDLDRTPAAA